MNIGNIFESQACGEVIDYQRISVQGANVLHSSSKVVQSGDLYNDMSLLSDTPKDYLGRPDSLNVDVTETDASTNHFSPVSVSGAFEDFQPSSFLPDKKSVMYSLSRTNGAATTIPTVRPKRRRSIHQAAQALRGNILQLHNPVRPRSYLDSLAPQPQFDKGSKSPSTTSLESLGYANIHNSQENPTIETVKNPMFPNFEDQLDELECKMEFEFSPTDTFPIAHSSSRCSINWDKTLAAFGESRHMKLPAQVGFTPIQVTVRPLCCGASDASSPAVISRPVPACKASECGSRTDNDNVVVAAPTTAPTQQYCKYHKQLLREELFEPVYDENTSHSHKNEHRYDTRTGESWLEA